MSVNQKRMKRIVALVDEGLDVVGGRGLLGRAHGRQNLAERSAGPQVGGGWTMRPCPLRPTATAPPRRPLLGDTIGANFERTAARFADRPALVSRHQEVRLTYAQLDAAVDAAARRAAARRASARGDRVGIWAPNCAEWVIVQYATAKVGAILVNINPAYRTHELEYALRQSGVRLLVQRQRVQDQRLPRDGRRGLRRGRRARARPSSSTARVGRVLRRRAVDRDAIAARMAELSFDDPINIQYTSGTTGFPKGATLSHHNILNNGFFVDRAAATITEADRVCLPVPFYHCFGMVMGNLGALAHGGCVVIPAPAFEPRATLEAVAAEGVHLALRRADDVHRRCSTTRTSTRSTSARCAPGSWPARRARSR